MDQDYKKYIQSYIKLIIKKICLKEEQLIMENMEISLNRKLQEIINFKWNLMIMI
jgi:hypothetical protein